jgi:hypothetical protein
MRILRTDTTGVTLAQEACAASEGEGVGPRAFALVTRSCIMAGTERSTGSGHTDRERNLGIAVVHPPIRGAWNVT